MPSYIEIFAGDFMLPRIVNSKPSLAILMVVFIYLFILHYSDFGICP